MHRPLSSILGLHPRVRLFAHEHGGEAVRDRHTLYDFIQTLGDVARVADDARLALYLGSLQLPTLIDLVKQILPAESLNSTASNLPSGSD